MKAAILAHFSAIPACILAMYAVLSTKFPFLKVMWAFLEPKSAFLSAMFTLPGARLAGSARACDYPSSLPISVCVRKRRRRMRRSSISNKVWPVETKLRKLSGEPPSSLVKWKPVTGISR